MKKIQLKYFYICSKLHSFVCFDWDTDDWEYHSQFFPEIISTKDDKYDEHPIIHAAMNGNNIRKVTNMMAVLNVPSMVEFAIELGSFENHERGGSLTYSHYKTSVIGRSYNVLQYLTMSSWS